MKGLRKQQMEEQKKWKLTLESFLYLCKKSPRFQNEEIIDGLIQKEEIEEKKEKKQKREN